MASDSMEEQVMEGLRILDFQFPDEFSHGSLKDSRFSMFFVVPPQQAP
jgi:hypothetical protein